MESVSEIETVVPWVDIEASDAWMIPLKLNELWAHRELIYFLTWREIKVRYKQTAMGAGWAILQPLLTMVIFSLFFGRLAKMPSEGVPYSLFSLAGLVPWTFVQNGLNLASNSLVGSSNLITKVYFPRLAIPLASVLSVLLDLGIAFVMLLAFMLFQGFVPSVRVVWLPLFVLLSVICSLGVSLWLAALNVEYRDIRYVVPFLSQLWMFGTPIAYPASLLHEPWRTVYGLNPMVGVVEGFRWCLLGAGEAPGLMVVISALAALLLLVTGAFYFRRMERTFADVI
jgi:lipopolysaccharide transport system permease protein